MGFPIFDSLMNLLSGLGTAKDKAAHSQYVNNVLSQAELDAAYRGDWIARKIVDIPAQDATRAWRNWQASDEQTQAIEEHERLHGLQGKVKRALVRERLYGGAAIIMGVDQGMPQDELDVEAVGKDDLKFLHVVSRYDLVVNQMDWNPSSKYYGQPVFYERRPVAGEANMTGIQIHPSRVIRLPGAEIPDTRVGTNDGWGDSVLQALDDAVRQCGVMAGGIAALMQEAKVDVIKIPDFTKNIPTREYAERLTARFTYANQAKSIVNALILDKEEEWERMSNSFAGLSEILKDYLMIASGAGDIPATRMLGQSPKGMHATGESDIRNYYDHINSDQETEMRPMLTPLDEVLIRSALGSRPPEIHYEWTSLWQLDEAQKADLASKKAAVVKIDVDSGLIPITALAKARQNQLVEDAFYPGLEDALAEAEAAGDVVEIPPTPEEQLALEVKKQQLLLPAPGAGGSAPAPSGSRPPPPGSGASGQRASNRDWQTIRDAAVADPPEATVTLRDMAPRPLYVRRDLLNVEEFQAWAREQGFEDLVDDPHVTLLYSRTPVDWMKMGSDWGGGDNEGNLRVAPGGPRAVESLGQGATCLLFANSSLMWRHEEMVRNGASHDYPEYQAHVTIAYGSTVDPATVEPYRGELVFGPEIFEEIDPQFDPLSTLDYSPDHPRDNSGQWQVSQVPDAGARAQCHSHLHRRDLQGHQRSAAQQQDIWNVRLQGEYQEGHAAPDGCSRQGEAGQESGRASGRVGADVRQDTGTRGQDHRRQGLRQHLRQREVREPVETAHDTDIRAQGPSSPSHRTYRSTL
jgi:phage-related protein (TIGR01555 family)